MNKALIMRDAERLSTTPKEYVEKNSYQYDLITKTWIGLATWVSPRLGNIYTDFLKRYSLVEAITLTQSLCNKLIQKVNGNAVTLTHEEEALILGITDIRDALQLLRYPKRFSPFKADKLEEKSLKEFMAINNRCYQICNRDYNATGLPFSTKLVEEVSAIIQQGLKAMNPKHAKPYFTNGATGDAGKLLAEKVRAMRVDLTTRGGSRVSGYAGPLVTYNVTDECSSVDGCIYNGSCYTCPMHEIEKESRILKYGSLEPKAPKCMVDGRSYTCPYTNLECDRKWAAWCSDTNLREVPLCSCGEADPGECDTYKRAYLNARYTAASRETVIKYRDCFANGSPCATVLPVPKSHKDARIVAEEDSWRQYCMTGVRSQILAALRPWKSHYDPEDQSPNQVAAFLGSIDKGYATIDFSSASDSISIATARALLPKEMFDLCSEYRATHLLFPNGQIRDNYIWMTSGCVLTFPLMVIILIGIAKWCESYTALFTGDSYLPVKVYGDDVVLDSRLVPLFTEVTAHFGFMINEAKSYWGTDNFRESCGADFINGVEVTTLYWPRAEVSDQLDSLATVISLQHKLYALGATDAAKAVVDSCKWKVSAANPMIALDHEWWADFPTRRTKEISGYLVEYASMIITTNLSASECARVAQSSPWFLQYCYTQYLEEGPLYEDPLLELLHVSTSRIRPAALAVGGLKLVERPV